MDSSLRSQKVFLWWKPSHCLLWPRFWLRHYIGWPSGLNSGQATFVYQESCSYINNALIKRSGQAESWSISGNYTESRSDIITVRHCFLPIRIITRATKIRRHWLSRPEHRPQWLYEAESMCDQDKGCMGLRWRPHYTVPSNSPSARCI